MIVYIFLIIVQLSLIVIGIVEVTKRKVYGWGIILLNAFFIAINISQLIKLIL